jgi:hypothetical protein
MVFFACGVVLESGLDVSLACVGEGTLSSGQLRSRREENVDFPCFPREGLARRLLGIRNRRRLGLPPSSSLSVIGTAALVGNRHRVHFSSPAAARLFVRLQSPSGQPS